MITAVALILPLLSFTSSAVDVDITSDYIIIGSGSAGSVTAGRLAAAGHDVLVLEAGGPTQSALGGCSVPGNCPFMRGNERNLTIFDVPLEWLQILLEPQYSDKYEWSFNTKRPGCLPSQADSLNHNPDLILNVTTSEGT